MENDPHRAEDLLAVDILLSFARADYRKIADEKIVMRRDLWDRLRQSSFTLDHEKENWRGADDAIGRFAGAFVFVNDRAAENEILLLGSSRLRIRVVPAVAAGAA